MAYEDLRFLANCVSLAVGVGTLLLAIKWLRESRR